MFKYLIILEVIHAECYLCIVFFITATLDYTK